MQISKLGIGDDHSMLRYSDGMFSIPSADVRQELTSAAAESQTRFAAGKFARMMPAPRGDSSTSMVSLMPFRLMHETAILVTTLLYWA